MNDVTWMPFCVMEYFPKLRMCKFLILSPGPQQASFSSVSVTGATVLPSLRLSSENSHALPHLFAFYQTPQAPSNTRSLSFSFSHGLLPQFPTAGHVRLTALLPSSHCAFLPEPPANSQPSDHWPVFQSLSYSNTSKHPSFFKKKSSFLAVLALSVAALKLSLAAVGRGYSSLWCVGFFAATLLIVEHQLGSGDAQA